MLLSFITLMAYRAFYTCHLQPSFSHDCLHCHHCHHCICFEDAVKQPSTLVIVISVLPNIPAISPRLRLTSNPSFQYRRGRGRVGAEERISTLAYRWTDGRTNGITDRQTISQRKLLSHESAVRD